MAKGGEFERSICYTLSRWWTSGAGDEVFWRSAGSGGRATVRARKGLSTDVHCGDIAAIQPIGFPLLKAFAVEVKRGYQKGRGYGATLADLMDLPLFNKQDVFYEEWIVQARESQQNSDALYWMIIHRRDKREALVLMPNAVFSNITIPPNIILDSHCSFTRMRWICRKTDESSLLIQLRLEDFLRLVSPEMIRKHLLGEQDAG